MDLFSWQQRCPFRYLEACCCFTPCMAFGKDQRASERETAYYADPIICLAAPNRLKQSNSHPKQPQVNQCSSPVGYRAGQALEAKQNLPLGRLLLKCPHCISWIIPATLTYHVASNFCPSGHECTRDSIPSHPPSYPLVLSSNRVSEQPIGWGLPLTTQHQAGLAASQ